MDKYYPFIFGVIPFVSFYNEKFSNLDKIIKFENRPDIIIFDLGLSTFQLQDYSRGFSFNAVNKIDMQMGLSDMSAEEVINTETRVNALDLKIENDCEKFLALYNPVAIDLRFIMAILKINFDLERIADHAYGISKYIIDQDKKIDARLFEVLKFDVIYETITSMFDDITGDMSEEERFQLDNIYARKNY